MNQRLIVLTSPDEVDDVTITSNVKEVIEKVVIPNDDVTLQEPLKEHLPQEDNMGEFPTYSGMKCLGMFRAKISYSIILGCQQFT